MSASLLRRSATELLSLSRSAGYSARIVGHVRFIRLQHFSTHRSQFPSATPFSVLGVGAGLLGVAAVVWIARGRDLHSEGSLVLSRLIDLEASQGSSLDDDIAQNYGNFSKLRGAIALINVYSAHISNFCKAKDHRQFTRAEISRHNCKENGIWIIHNNGVYDITEFIDLHPGGEYILLAAGRCIDPYWSVFTIHQTPETKELLEQYRIGNLIKLEDPNELAELKKADKMDRKALEELFKYDPARHPDLIQHSQFPCNAEAPQHAIVDQPITPTPLFFVRNHLPVPSIDPQAYRLAVEGPGIPDDLTISLEQLKKLPKHTITATLQCAGNRRKDMHAVKPTKGLQWSQGAISTATWSGVLLRDVLQTAGFNSQASDISNRASDGSSISHVQFHGSEGYGASIPLVKAVSSNGDVLLAYEMNGEPLPADHGAPVRVVVPGHVAARSVKWVDRITLSDEESQSHWQQKDYKGFSPSVENPGEEDYENAKSIQELPVQSAVLSPKQGELVLVSPEGMMKVKGYAVSGGGRDIIRVDVSADGGNTWTTANLIPAAKPSLGRQWAWTQWDVDVPVTKEGNMEVVCKAVDESYNVQPEHVQGIWNMRGVLSTAWHRISANVQKENEQKSGKSQ